MDKDGIRPFRFWVQPILPLAYDDSLSYLEVLLKVKIKLNEVIDWANNYKDELYQYVDQKTQENLQQMQAQLTAFQTTINLRLDQQDRNIAQINSNVNNLLNTVNSIISQFQKDIDRQIAQFRLETQTQLREFSTQINAQIANNEAWVKAQIAAQNAYINAQLQAINLALDQNLIEANRYTDEKIKEALEGLEPGVTDIIYPDDYVKMTIQEAINRLWYDLSFFTLTAQEYDDLDLTAQLYDDEELTAYQYDLYGKWYLKYKGSGGSGKDGVTFIPEVSEDGIISWTNDGNLPNPAPVNIMGPRGPQGPSGEGEGNSIPLIFGSMVNLNNLTVGSVKLINVDASQLDKIPADGEKVIAIANWGNYSFLLEGTIEPTPRAVIGVSIKISSVTNISTSQIIYSDDPSLPPANTPALFYLNKTGSHFYLNNMQSVLIVGTNSEANIDYICTGIVQGENEVSYIINITSSIVIKNSGSSIPEPPETGLGYLANRLGKYYWEEISAVNPVGTSYVLGAPKNRITFPPSSLFPCLLPPTDGNTGDVFTKTESGAEWAPPAGGSGLPPTPGSGKGYLSFHITGNDPSTLSIAWTKLTQKSHPDDFALVPYYDTTVTSGLPTYLAPTYLVPFEGDTGKVLMKSDAGVAWEDPPASLENFPTTITQIGTFGPDKKPRYRVCFSETKNANVSPNASTTVISIDLSSFNPIAESVCVTGMVNGYAPGYMGNNITLYFYYSNTSKTVQARIVNKNDSPYMPGIVPAYLQVEFCSQNDQ